MDHLTLFCRLGFAAGFAFLCHPMSYAGGSFTPGRVTHAR